MTLISDLIAETIHEETKRVTWPKQFRNRDTGRIFVPQNEEVATQIFEVDTPAHVYLMSGEGAGKTASLAVLTLNKLRRGMSGAFICVDLPMLIKVWNEFKLWIPEELVIPEHRGILSEAWTPYRSIFEVVFYAETGGYSKLIIGGLGNEYGKWESLNINFFIIDEARHIPNERIMKIVTGRLRIDGPNGEPPQLIVGSTPTDTTHWMYDWFGPQKPKDEEDLQRGFKAQTKVVRLSVADNLQNLNADYMERRGLSLTEAEKQVYIHGQWGNLKDDNKFLESIELWRRLYDADLKPPRKRGESRAWADMIVVAMDGATKNDTFAMVGVSRDPKSRDDVAVRLKATFKPVNGGIDFSAVETTLREWCADYNVVTVVFDPYQLYDMTERLRKEHVAWFQEFSQQGKRLQADSLLHELILQRRIIHSGDTEIDQHMRNAGAAYDSRKRKRRIVKIHHERKVDLVVTVAMAAYECLRLNI